MTAKEREKQRRKEEREMKYYRITRIIDDCPSEVL